MASRVLTLRRVMKCASTLGFCTSARLDKFHSELSPAVVTVESSFFASDNREIRRGSGVFLDPGIIVTSAHVVGRLSAVYEHSGTVQKRDGSEHGKILHKSYIGTTNAFSAGNKRLKTTPLAVSFVNDVAVLGVVDKPEGALLGCCRLADPQPLPLKENAVITTVMAIAQQRLQLEFVTMLNNFRAASEKKARGKAPWPLDDGLGWIKRDFYMPVDGGDRSVSGKIPFNEEVDGCFAKFSGSPWFNLQGEVVGIASWDLRDENYLDIFVSFGVPPLCIRSAMDYAKMKGPQDPIVMDPWINAHEIQGN